MGATLFLQFIRSSVHPSIPSEICSHQPTILLKIFIIRQDSLFWSLFKVLKWEFFAQFLWAVPWCILINVSPYCLNKIIGYVECKDCGPPTAVQYLYVFGLLFSSLLESLTDQQALHIGRRIFLHTISICNAEVFAKSLRRKDMASPADKEEGEKEEGGEKKKDGSLNIASKSACSLLLFSYTSWMAYLRWAVADLFGCT